MNKTILKVAVTILAFFSTHQSLLGNQYGLSEESLNMARAWSKSDKSVASDYKSLLSDKTFQRLPQPMKQKVFNYTFGNRSALRLFALNDFRTYGGRYKRFMWKKMLGSTDNSFVKAFQGIVTSTSFARLKKKLMFNAFKRNPLAIKAYPGAASQLVDLVNFQKPFTNLDHYTKLLVYRIAAQYPAAIKAIGNFIKTSSFKNPKFNGSKYNGNKQLVSLQGVQLQIIGVLGERKSLAKKSLQKELLKNTLAAMASGRVELRIISSGRDGEADREGKYIEINYSSHGISIYNVKMQKRDMLASTVAHEINHCTRPMLHTATFKTFRDEYGAYYVGRIASTGKEPTCKEMLEDIETIKTYNAVVMAYSNRDERYKIESFIKQIKSRGLDTTAPFVFSFSKNNSMGGSSYASLSNQPSRAVTASGTPINDENVDLLGAQANKVNAASAAGTTPTSTECSDQEMFASTNPSGNSELIDGIQITYDEGNSFIDG